MLGFHSIERGTFSRVPVRRKGPPRAVPKAVNVRNMSATVMHVQPKAGPTALPKSRPPPTLAPSSLFRAPPAPSVSDYTTLVEVVNKIWDIVQQTQSRTEREVGDLRQQHNLLANRREEESAELSTVLTELSSLKQRLARTMTQAEGQLHAMERASMPAQVLKDLSQLQTDSNWVYATVTVSKLFFYARPTTTMQPHGSFAHRQRILALYKTVENEEGLWMQVRHATEPEKRFWIRLTDSEGKVTVGNFDLVP